MKGPLPSPTLREDKLGLFHITLNTEFRALWGRRREGGGRWAYLTPVTSPNPFFRKATWLLVMHFWKLPPEGRP